MIPKFSDLDHGAKTIRNIALGMFYVVFWIASVFLGHEEEGGSQNGPIWDQVPNHLKHSFSNVLRRVLESLLFSKK